MDGNNQINFLSPETASRIKNITGTSVQRSTTPKTGDLQKKDLFYLIRRARLLSSPTWDETHKIWESDAELIEHSLQQQNIQKIPITVAFDQKTEPQCGEDDVIYVVYRGGEGAPWVALIPDPLPRIVRILTTYPLDVNRWKYSVQLVSFAESNSYSPVLDYESTPEGINLCETENLETGLMGNGINLNGFAPSGTTNHYLAPVPFGTLVFAFGFNFMEGGKEKKVYAFQFQNQLQHPFSSHLCETTQDPLTGPSQSGQEPDDNHLTMSINGRNQKVYCPLLREGETIPAGTAVILSQNIKTGYWEIIEVQCPAAAASTAGEENGTGESEEDNPDNGQQSENPEDGE